MSIKELTESAPFAPRTKDVVIEVAGKQMTFTAVQLSYLDCLDLAVEGRRGDANRYAMQIAKSIVDPEGNHMTVEQATKLPDDIAEKFWEASTEVNKREPVEKK